MGVTQNEEFSGFHSLPMLLALTLNLLAPTTVGARIYP